MRPRFDGLVSTRACPQVQPRELPQGKKELAELRRVFARDTLASRQFVGSSAPTRHKWVTMTAGQVETLVGRAGECVAALRAGTIERTERTLL